MSGFANRIALLCKLGDVLLRYFALGIKSVRSLEHSDAVVALSVTYTASLVVDDIGLDGHVRMYVSKISRSFCDF